MEYGQELGDVMAAKGSFRVGAEEKEAGLIDGEDMAVLVGGEDGGGAGLGEKAELVFGLAAEVLLELELRGEAHVGATVADDFVDEETGTDIGGHDEEEVERCFGDGGGIAECDAKGGAEDGQEDDGEAGVDGAGDKDRDDVEGAEGEIEADGPIGGGGGDDGQSDEGGRGPGRGLKDALEEDGDGRRSIQAGHLPTVYRGDGGAGGESVER